MIKSASLNFKEHKGRRALKTDCVKTPLFKLLIAAENVLLYNIDTNIIEKIDTYLFLQKITSIRFPVPQVVYFQNQSFPQSDFSSINGFRSI